MKKKNLLNLVLEIKNYDYDSIEPEITAPEKKPEVVKPIEHKSLKDTKSGKKLF